MIERVAVIGAGGLGAVYANIFNQAGITTKLVAKGERYERLVRDGVYINDAQYRIPVLDAANSDEVF